MGTAAPKAEVASPKRSACLFGPIGVVTICSLGALSGVAVEISLHLAGICSCVRAKLLVTNGIPDNGSVCLNFLLGRLHSAKNNREPTALMGSKHVMELTIVWVVTMENGDEALI
jgi:hypothetical protein